MVNFMGHLDSAKAKEEFQVHEPIPGAIRYGQASLWTCRSYLVVGYGNEVRVTLLVFHLMQTYEESFFPLKCIIMAPCLYRTSL